MDKYERMKKEINTYNNLHRIDLYSVYLSDNEKNESYYKEKNIDKSKLANFLNSNLSNMNEDEKKVMLLKCLTPEKVEKELLKFEFSNYKPNKKKFMSLKTFEKEAKKLLNRYQWKAGGYYIEDNIWNSYKRGNKYDIKINEIVLENTIDRNDSKEAEFINFMRRMIYLLNNLAENITTKYKCIESKEDSLSWVVIKVTDKSCKKKKIEL